MSAKLLKNGTLKTYKDFPHGMPMTQRKRLNVIFPVASRHRSRKYW